MSAAHKLQHKLFKNVSSPPPISVPSPNPSSSPELTIEIPPTKQSPKRPFPKPSGDDTPPLSIPIPEGTKPFDPRNGETYREYVLNLLGTDYSSVERHRLEQDERKERHWKRWGPYLSERQWATVREDYSHNGDAWTHFPHSAARSRAYRWGEDGLAGLSDNHQRLCFSLALWNGVDPILKERLFGVTGHEGNHGEDVKELYYYLDSTPTHSFMKFLYKYPQAPFPYEELVRESTARSREVNEFEILDTDVWDDDRYWDVFVEYAKDADDPNAISVRITAFNRGPDPADIHIIPQLFFPNTWSWPLPTPPKPVLRAKQSAKTGLNIIEARHPSLQTNLYCLPSPPPAPAMFESEEEERRYSEGESVFPELMFTENDTNFERLYGGTNKEKYVKDAFHDHIIPSHRPKYHQSPDGDLNGDGASTPRGSPPATPTPVPAPAPAPTPIPAPPAHQYINPAQTGTKSAAHYHFKAVPPRGGCAVIRLKLTPTSPASDPSILDEELFDENVDQRRQDADEFYKGIAGGGVSDDLKSIMRQALSGMLWSKQYYKFIQDEWINGDPAQPAPPPERRWVRNREWRHLYIADILSMPDKWEYPFFAAWDTAFHCIPLAMVDPAFAKKQLDLLTREWYMKPDGQIPAYEWNFSDVNPPVHAWATFRVFKIERKLFQREDLEFLERVFQKLLLNFTWWVNRKDSGGNNVFEGGFLGLDNIGAFNRSEPLPTGGVLRQADGTAWMAFFCLNMLNMALELAKHNPVYEDIASKFFEHFIFIADAMTYRGTGDNELSLWNEELGFYFDAIQWGPGHSQQLPIRSLVGLIPLYATLTLEPSVINRFPGFKKRMEWFLDNRSELSGRNMANLKVPGKGERRLLALASKERLVRILEKMLDEDEFFSDYGIRSLSLYHKDNPFSMHVNGQEFGVGYWPGDSRSGMFGGNSNWRGPIWLATNFLLIESLQRFHQYYGDELQVECPSGSGEYMNLLKVAEEIQHRIIHIFGRDEEGRRATNGGSSKLDRDPHFRDLVLFHEFFHGNDGRGLGASHQTGWTGLVAYHIVQSGITCRLPRTPRTPRSLARHYFDDSISDAHSEGPVTDEPYSARSAFSMMSELMTPFGDISPEAL